MSFPKTGVREATCALKTLSPPSWQAVMCRLAARQFLPASQFETY
jgi:hypothetical protein